MAEPVNLCGSCGHGNAPDSVFCGRCGATLLPPAEDSVSVQQPAPGVVTAAAAADVLAPTAVEYAGLWFRFLALLVDGLAVAGLSLCIGLIVYELLDVGSLGFCAECAVLIGLLAVWGVGPVYFWLLTGIRGQTLGKMAMAIRVMSGSGGTPGLGRAALRELLAKPVVYLLSVGPLLGVAGLVWFNLYLGGYMSDVPTAFWLFPAVGFVGLLGFLWMIWDPRKQGWHDKIAGTYVVKKPRRSRE